MGWGWAGFGSVKIQNLICLQNWAVCGALLDYFPQLCYHLSHVCFRHNLRQTAPCLSCSTQTHIDTASAEESRATFLDAKSSRGLWALQQSIRGYLKTILSFLPHSAVMEYFWKLGFSQPVVFLLPLSFISQVLTNQYVSQSPGRNSETLKRVHWLLSHRFHSTISEYWFSLWWQKSLSKK